MRFISILANNKSNLVLLRFWEFCILRGPEAETQKMVNFAIPYGEVCIYSWMFMKFVFMLLAIAA